MDLISDNLVDEIHLFRLYYSNKNWPIEQTFLNQMIGMDGKIFAKKTESESCNQVHISNLNAGLYFAEVNNKIGQLTRVKFIKE
ncbi:MAG: T9SS type A sorting domain-containing protein [Crocinitomicaceae bacterium]